MSMRMNLTGLADVAYAQLASKGRPLAIPLDDILPDPDNPRNADDDSTPEAVAAQEDLDSDVAARGVKTPISVRPHPTLPGKYLINYGHRRYKSARRNHMATIPAFVDEQFDSYDQLNENELRIGLTTRARALFIKKRLDAGDTKGQITERMRKRSQNFITEHLALIDAPDCVNQAYANGVTSARTLYDLRQAWNEFPERIDAWAREPSRITRETIKEALDRFRHDEIGAGEGRKKNGQASLPSPALDTESTTLASPPQAPPVVPKFRHDEKMDSQASRSGSTLVRPKMPFATGDIMVRYKGRAARVAAGATLTVFVEGEGTPREVLLSEVVFERSDSASDCFP